MNSEFSTNFIRQSPQKRKSLLNEMFKNMIDGQDKSTPQKGNQSDFSPLRRQGSLMTPSTNEKEQEKMLFKKAYNAILDSDLEAIDQVLFQLQIQDKNINSPLKKCSYDGRALIHLVAETTDQNDVVMKYIIEQKGADVNLQDSFGNIPVHLACKSGKLSTVQYLESKGSDLKIQNKLGDYSVIFAVQSGNLELVKYLQSKEIPMNLQNQSNLNSLNVALYGDHIDISGYLIENYEKFSNQET